MAEAAAQIPESHRRAFEALEKRLWNDAKIGPEVQKIIKEMYPDAKTNADVFDPVVAPLRERLDALAEENKKLREDREAEKRAQQEAAQKQNLESALDAARKAYQLTPEGFDMMVSRMKETGNYGDAEAAAAWVAAKTQPKEVKGPSIGPAKLDVYGVGKKDDSWAKVHHDPGQYVEDQLREFVANPDKYVADTFGAAA